MAQGVDISFLNLPIRVVTEDGADIGSVVGFNLVLDAEKTEIVVTIKLED